jgi:hypothetical protein
MIGKHGLSDEKLSITLSHLGTAKTALALIGRKDIALLPGRTIS